MRVRHTNPTPHRGPRLDEVELKGLYRKSSYEVETADHWTLVITRYQPVPQPFEQPLLGEPLLLVHGFSQNRHAWTCGKFVKHMLLFGVDIHVLELRGHGKSSLRLQRQKAAQGGRLPADLDYGWDIDSYFLYDLPAAVAAVKRATHRDAIYFCGHSMGGMLGYGYAGLHDDLKGLITIGAPSDIGVGYPALKAISCFQPVGSRLIDAWFAGDNAVRGAAYLAGAGWEAVRSVIGRPAGRPVLRPERRSFRYIPVDRLLRSAERVLASNYAWLDRVWPYVGFFPNPARVAAADIRWLLREGGEREPRAVAEQFARWVRHRELVCYRTGYDFKRGFSNIKIPVAIIFGDMDRLASVQSTRSIYRGARSDYLLWRPVKGNSHVELTIGHDIEQICYDVKNLMDYARSRGAAAAGSRPLRAPLLRR